MKRILPLVTGALIVLGAMLGAASSASATVPPEHSSYSAVVTSLVDGPFWDGYHRLVQVNVHRDGDSVGEVTFDASYATNHLGQHRQFLEIDDEPGADVHVRVDTGSSVLDWHVTTSRGIFQHTFYYPVRKFRVTLDSWGSGWFAPPIG
jgi:hypothetical protein